MKAAECLWAPWRMGYILGEKEKGCIFCDKPAVKRDGANHIFLRRARCFGILNIYPYNNGHCMIVPYSHKKSITLLKKAERSELFETVSLVTAALGELLLPDGFNIGINEGRVAGAGIDEHVHIHIVPRWNGDTNFMPVLSRTKVMNDYLDALYHRLKKKLS